ncbi:MAG: hypothetical protein JJE44_11335 [Flavobacteriaceae bacterium]|nr:hypothetical protein [Flavobacteriaceae bacterium]
MKGNILEKMREAFSNIPINIEDEIEEDFYWGKMELIVLKFDIGLMKSYQMELLI